VLSFATTRKITGSTPSVGVNTWDKNGSSSNQDFHLAVLC
jgi:hypothetical protein